jgi:hypothetical protein
MSRIIAARRPSDHFEPDEHIDPKVQRQLRGHLEQIDHTAYSANRRVLTATLASVDTTQLQSLASATALARTRWVAAGLALAEAEPYPTPGQITALAELRTAYEELSEVYDGLRRMVERGYLTYATEEPA